MDEWMKVLNRVGNIKRIPFDKKYGEYNKIYNNNIRLMKNINVKIMKTKTVYVIHPHSKFTHPSGYKPRLVSEIIPTILTYLENNNNVIYVPKISTKRMVTRMKKIMNKPEISFLCRNDNLSTSRYKKQYILHINKEYPMAFKPNRVLKHLLYMSNNFSQIEKHFSRTIIFLYFIRCLWI